MKNCYGPQCLIPEFLVSSASVSTCLRVKAILRSLPICFFWYLNYLIFLKKKKHGDFPAMSSHISNASIHSSLLRFCLKKHLRIIQDFILMIFQNSGFTSALAGVAPWIKHWPVNWAVTGLIPSQGTCLGCRPGPWLGVCKRQPIDVSLPLFLPPFFSLWKKIKKIFFKKDKFWFHFHEACVFTLSSYIQLLSYHKSNMQHQVRVPSPFSWVLRKNQVTYWNTFAWHMTNPLQAR